MRPSIDKILSYNNPDIVDRLAVETKISLSDANEIFQETLRWLWLCAEARIDRKEGIDVPRLIIDEPLRFIDLGWHTFLLHTKVYAEFCDKHFGFFIHHNPTPVRKKETLTEALDRHEQARQELIDHRQRQYEYIFDKLGPEILTSWYERLADKYSNLGKAG